MSQSKSLKVAKPDHFNLWKLMRNIFTVLSLFAIGYLVFGSFFSRRRGRENLLQPNSAHQVNDLVSQLINQQDRFPESLRAQLGYQPLNSPRNGMILPLAKAVRRRTKAAGLKSTTKALTHHALVSTNYLQDNATFITYPVGNPFKVNTKVYEDQYNQSMASANDGSFVIVWMSNQQDGSSWGIYGQRYFADGTKLGAEFQVNTYTTNSQSNPTVSYLANGNFVVAWESYNGVSNAIYAQRYDSNGVKLGSEFLINIYRIESQKLPVIASLNDGGFIIAWQIYGQNSYTSSKGIYAQRYDANGIKQSVEFKVNTTVLGDQAQHAITVLSNGSFVIAWSNNDQEHKLLAQRYDASGAAQGGEFLIAKATMSEAPRNIAMSALNDGGFVVAWSTRMAKTFTDNHFIYIQRYNASGVIQGPKIKVASDKLVEIVPAIKTLKSGHFVVVWSQSGQTDMSKNGIFAKRYDASGKLQADEFAVYVSQSSYSRMQGSAIVDLSDGGFIVSWASSYEDDSSYAVYARRYGLMYHPPGLIMNRLMLTPGAQLVVDEGVLAAADQLIDNNTLMFNLTQVQHGRFEFITKPGIAITRFTQSQLSKGLIQFVHDASEEAPSYQVMVSNGYLDTAFQAAIIDFRLPEFVPIRPISNDFQVNSYSVISPTYPVISSLNDGGFVVVWQNKGQDSTNNNIYAQRYDVSGQAQGSEFRVNTYLTDSGDRANPAITSLADGGFVVTWQSQNQDHNSYGIFAQRYDANGVQQNTEFQVNTYTSLDQIFPTITNLVDGGFVIAWSSNKQDGSNYGIYAQRYDSQGLKQGNEFKVNTYTLNDQTRSTITGLSGGGFVIAWSSHGQDGDGTGIYGQRYDAQGTPQGSEFRINTYTNGGQYSAKLAGLNDGGFIVAWAGFRPNNLMGSNINLRRYDANGVKQTGEFLFMGDTTSDFVLHKAIALQDGGFAITWLDNNIQNQYDKIFVQCYAANGAKLNPVFQVSSDSASGQIYSAIASSKDKGFVVAWLNYSLDGSSYSIHAQRYGILAPVLRHNQFEIDQGEMLVLNTTMLSAYDTMFDNSTLVFNLTEIKHGHFEFLSEPDHHVTQFTQLDLEKENVVFIHDGSNKAPSYKVAVNNGYVSTTEQLAVIYFTLALETSISSFVATPLASLTASSALPSSALSLSEQALASTYTAYSSDSAMQQASSQTISNSFLAFSSKQDRTSSNVGLSNQAESISLAFPSEAVSSNSAELASFSTDTTFPQETPWQQSMISHYSPTLFLSQTSIPSSLPQPSAAESSELASPLVWLLKVQFSLKQGETLILNQSQLQARHGDALPEQLIYTVSQVQHGRFEKVIDPENAINSFTQQQINEQRVQFVHDGSKATPSFTFTVSDGRYQSSEKTSDINFIASIAKASKQKAVIGGTVGGIVGGGLIGTCCIGTALFALAGAAAKRKKQLDLPDLEQGIELAETAAKTL